VYRYIARVERSLWWAGWNVGLATQYSDGTHWMRTQGGKEVGMHSATRVHGQRWESGLLFMDSPVEQISPWRRGAGDRLSGVSVLTVPRYYYEG